MYRQQEIDALTEEIKKLKQIILVYQEALRDANKATVRRPKVDINNDRRFYYE